MCLQFSHDIVDVVFLWCPIYTLWNIEFIEYRYNVLFEHKRKHYKILRVGLSFRQHLLR